MDIKMPGISPIEFKDPLKIQYETVNRLIMVGNGFDLAHGLKTSFKDFLFDYIRNVLVEAEKYNEYEDRLVRLQLTGLSLEPGWTVKSLEKRDPLDLLNIVSTHPNGRIDWKSKFFKLLINEVETKNWVDIEIIYFDLLKKAVSQYRMDEVSNLNEELNAIKEYLITYLKEEQKKASNDINRDLLKQFQAQILTDDVLPDTIDNHMHPDRCCFLNFNYTNTLHKYVEAMPPIDSVINQIHGCLEPIAGCQGPPIFGFGDELDENYMTFEKQRDDRVFEHIKTFKYLENSNYRYLMDFINSNPFQIHIYGHSCGISDRTMLNTIFEDENCIGIKVFYHDKGGGENDFTVKNYSIARHFKSKSMFRNKMVNFRYCSPMAQYKK